MEKHMINRHKILAMIVAATSLCLLNACGIGKPIPIPEPESQLTPKPGLLSDENGEIVVYRKQ